MSCAHYQGKLFFLVSRDLFVSFPTIVTQWSSKKKKHCSSIDTISLAIIKNVFLKHDNATVTIFKRIPRLIGGFTILTFILGKIATHRSNNSHYTILAKLKSIEFIVICAIITSKMAFTIGTRYWPITIVTELFFTTFACIVTPF